MASPTSLLTLTKGKPESLFLYSQNSELLTLAALHLAEQVLKRRLKVIYVLPDESSDSLKVAHEYLAEWEAFPGQVILCSRLDHLNYHLKAFGRANIGLIFTPWPSVSTTTPSLLDAHGIYRHVSYFKSLNRNFGVSTLVVAPSEALTLSDPVRLSGLPTASVFQAADHVFFLEHLYRDQSYYLLEKYASQDNLPSGGPQSENITFLQDRNRMVMYPQIGGVLPGTRTFLIGSPSFGKDVIFESWQEAAMLDGEIFTLTINSVDEEDEDEPAPEPFFIPEDVKKVLRTKPQAIFIDAKEAYSDQMLDAVRQAESLLEGKGRVFVSTPYWHPTEGVFWHYEDGQLLLRDK